MTGIREILLTIAGSLLLIAALVFWYSYEPSADNSQQPPIAPDQTETESELDTDATQDEEVQNDDDFSNENEIDVTDMINQNNPTATITTNHGSFTLELFASDMPITVDNFITLAKDGFYDGTKFHRIIPGFMIQGGDPNTREDDTSSYGQGGPGYTIQDEFVAGEHLSNTPGTIAMANTGQPNSGGSQFFINVADNRNLDFDTPPMQSRHPVFGQVLDGMDVVEQIEAAETGARDIPVDSVEIVSVVINDA